MYVYYIIIFFKKPFIGLQEFARWRIAHFIGLFFWFVVQMNSLPSSNTDHGSFWFQTTKLINGNLRSIFSAVYTRTMENCNDIIIKFPFWRGL
jgi:hypothetical protein